MVQAIQGHLLTTLQTHFNVEVITTKTQAMRVLADAAVKVVIANDALAAPLLQPFLNRGGTVIFAGLFSNFTNMPDFRACFSRLGLPWKDGDYCRSDYWPTPTALEHFKGLPPAYNAKALSAQNVAPDDRVYTPNDKSKVHSMVFPATPLDVDSAAVAFGKAQGGYVGYVGDVNGEEATSYIVRALAVWAASQ
jgi:hypothetical protein